MSSRPTGAAVSCGPFPGWEAQWPEIAAEVERKVRGKLPPGVEPCDVSNEVAARLLASRNVPPADRLRYWCLAVARYVVADLFRSKALREQDLPVLPPGDVESLVLARLRLRSVIESLSALPGADRAALTSNVTPLTDSLKARRKRARKVMRDRMLRSVGGGWAIPKVRWLTGGTAAVAAAVPFVAGVVCFPPGPAPLTTAPEARVVAAASTDHDSVPGSEDAPAVAGPHPPAPAGPTSAEVEAAIRNPVVAVRIPGAGPADAGTFDDGRPGPPPLICARNLPSGDVCVAHPLR